MLTANFWFGVAAGSAILLVYWTATSLYRWKKNTNSRMNRKITPVDYYFQEPTSGNRFYVSVEIKPPGGTTLNFYALVDTGADDLILPAAIQGRFTTGGAVVASSVIHTGHGSPRMPVLSAYTFLVDGVSVTADVVFSGNLSLSAAICGRIPLLRATNDAGFSASEWLRS
jgi:hypothetical protein